MHSLLSIVIIVKTIRYLILNRNGKSESRKDEIGEKKRKKRRKKKSHRFNPLT